MRRADRLFQIVNVLRRRRTATTAAHLAERLGVSERTVYRDIRDLVLAGTPIDGEAGVGYRIRPGYDLPPLMFDRDEIQALVIGARIVRQFGDPALARASDSILGKVAAIVPKDLAPLVADTRLFVPTIVGAGNSAAALAVAREAVIARRKLEVSYANAEGTVTESDGAATRHLLLGPDVDVGRMVRAARGLPQLPPRSSCRVDDARRDVRGRGGQDAPRHDGALRPRRGPPDRRLNARRRGGRSRPGPSPRPGAGRVTRPLRSSRGPRAAAAGTACAPRPDRRRWRRTGRRGWTAARRRPSPSRR